MQKVERKKRKSDVLRGQSGTDRSSARRRRKWPWVLFGLLAAAILLIFLILPLLSRSGQETETHPDRSSGGILFSRSPEEISRIQITRRNGETWEVERENEALFPAGQRSWQVDSSLGDPLQDAVTYLEYEDILSENWTADGLNPDDFGLSNPRVIAEVTFTDGQTLTIRIGDSVPGLDVSWAYMTVSGDSRLYAVSEAIVRDLDVEEALLHPVVQPVILAALLDRITILNEAGVPSAEWVLKGEITSPGAGESWFLTSPLRYPADSDRIRSLKESAANFRLGAWFGPATPENLRSTGLTNPRATLVFHMAEGSTGAVSDLGVYDVQDWPERTVTVFLGDSRDENASYLRYEEEIYVVNRIAWAPFTDLNPLDTVARYPVSVPLTSLAELRLEESGETTVYTIQTAQVAPDGQTTGLSAADTAERSSSASSASSDSEETGSAFIVLKNGEPISAEAFEAAYDRLLTVTVSGLLPEEYRASHASSESVVQSDSDILSQAVIKKYTFQTVNGETHTLAFWPFDAMHEGLTQDGCTLFYLIKDGMTPLP